MQKYRDLTVLSINETEQLVIACDSSAAIGEKAGDIVQVSPSVTAAFCLRVPLMELLSVGAQPLVVVDLIGNEYDETGRLMIEGLHQELAKADLAHLPLNGSTEENMSTIMSSIGITVIGKVAKGELKYGQLRSGDQLFYLGKPYVGTEVLANQTEIFSYGDIRRLTKEIGVRELLPVGSKGILHEAVCLAASSQLTFKLDEANSHQHQPILTTSAGPATVLIVAVSPEQSSEIAKNFSLTYLGEVKEGTII